MGGHLWFVCSPPAGPYYSEGKRGCPCLEKGGAIAVPGCFSVPDFPWPLGWATYLVSLLSTLSLFPKNDDSVVHAGNL